jgi:hypothetical protein
MCSQKRLHEYRNQFALRGAVQKATGISSATLMRIEHGEAFDTQTFLALWRWMLEPADV